MASLSCFSLNRDSCFLGWFAWTRSPRWLFVLPRTEFYVLELSRKFQRRRDLQPFKQVSLFFRCFEVEVEGASSSGMLHGRGLLTFAINT